MEGVIPFFTATVPKAAVLDGAKRVHVGVRMQEVVLELGTVEAQLLGVSASGVSIAPFIVVTLFICIYVGILCVHRLG